MIFLIVKRSKRVCVMFLNMIQLAKCYFLLLLEYEWYSSQTIIVLSLSCPG